MLPDLTIGQLFQDGEYISDDIDITEKHVKSHTYSIYK